MRLWDTPVPIPNTMVKTQAADGTLLETVRSMIKVYAPILRVVRIKDWMAVSIAMS